MGTVVIKDPPAITPTGHNGIKKNKRQDPPSLGAFDWGGGGWEVRREERGDLPGRSKDSMVTDATL